MNDSGCLLLLVHLVGSFFAFILGGLVMLGLVKDYLTF